MIEQIAVTQGLAACSTNISVQEAEAICTFPDSKLATAKFVAEPRSHLLPHGLVRARRADQHKRQKRLSDLLRRLRMEHVAGLSPAGS